LVIAEGVCFFKYSACDTTARWETDANVSGVYHETDLFGRNRSCHENEPRSSRRVGRRSSSACGATDGIKLADGIKHRSHGSCRLSRNREMSAVGNDPPSPSEGGDGIVAFGNAAVAI
jgi:hypothetical protein